MTFVAKILLARKISGADSFTVNSIRRVMDK